MSVRAGWNGQAQSASNPPSTATEVSSPIRVGSGRVIPWPRTTVRLRLGTGGPTGNGSTQQRRGIRIGHSSFAATPPRDHAGTGCGRLETPSPGTAMGSASPAPTLRYGAYWTWLRATSLSWGFRRPTHNFWKIPPTNTGGSGTSRQGESRPRRGPKGECE